MTNNAIFSVSTLEVGIFNKVVNYRKKEKNIYIETMLVKS